ncbi:alkaline phosphatase family protein [Porphyromonas sp. COT-290 OH860]|uniref:alkaline phosphatase family protein n=1 Tax=Porphyromonas sp. COT-290 OH860 TaxID=1515615 RepID=UPI00052C5A8C|nr:alkaline phosphatase family protein [Porphyromonas sp. COT-290 OH860]KGN81936.1 nucleotide pyrophosphatase [Porphyromonas sp. COT-290 OH860]
MEQRHIRYLLSSLVALVAIQMQASAQQLPRMVVCITVDQLRSDYLTELEPMMSQGGFKRMLQEGKVYPSVRFPLTPIDGASATTSIYTSAYPEMHGVEGRSVYLRSKNKVQPTLWDESVHGVYTRERLSPRAIQVNTLADRLKEASAGSALVYSVGINAEEAMAGAGVLADGCFWLDDRVAAWSTSSFYPSMPQYLDRYNKSDDGPNRRLISGTMRWSPLRSYADQAVGYSSWHKNFTKYYQGHEAAAYKRSALANEEVTTLALQLIRQGGYEYRKAPSLLSVSYSAAPHGSGELEVEDADTYLRLDRNLEQIFQALEEKIGLKNCLISLSGTGYTSYEVPKPQIGAKLARQLSIKRATALLNMYISALHGAGSWIEQVQDGRLYLNGKLAEAKKIALRNLQEEVALFLRQVEGIGSATSAHEILTSNALNRQQRALRRSIHHKHLADVYWSLTPGWYLEEIAEHPSLQRATTTAIASPFVLMGAGVDPKRFDFPVQEATDIVRAISWVLRIRPPNAAI